MWSERRGPRATRPPRGGSPSRCRATGKPETAKIRRLHPDLILVPASLAGEAAALGSQLPRPRLRRRQRKVRRHRARHHPDRRADRVRRPREVARPAHAGARGGDPPRGGRRAARPRVRRQRVLLHDRPRRPGGRPDHDGRRRRRRSRRRAREALSAGEAARRQAAGVPRRRGPRHDALRPADERRDQAPAGGAVGQVPPDRRQRAHRHAARGWLRRCARSPMRSTHRRR